MGQDSAPKMKKEVGSPCDYGRLCHRSGNIGTVYTRERFFNVTGSTPRVLGGSAPGVRKKVKNAKKDSGG